MAAGLLFLFGIVQGYILQYKRFFYVTMGWEEPEKSLKECFFWTVCEKNEIGGRFEMWTK